MKPPDIYTCDGCGEVIDGDSAMPRHDMLVLTLGSAPRLKPDPGARFAIHQSPMLERDYHFHNRRCLKAWMADWPSP